MKSTEEENKRICVFGFNENIFIDLQDFSHTLGLVVVYNGNIYVVKYLLHVGHIFVATHRAIMEAERILQYLTEVEEAAEDVLANKQQVMFGN